MDSKYPTNIPLIKKKKKKKKKSIPLAIFYSNYYINYDSIFWLNLLYCTCFSKVGLIRGQPASFKCGLASAENSKNNTDEESQLENSFTLFIGSFTVPNNTSEFCIVLKCHLYFSNRNTDYFYSFKNKVC